MIKEINKKEVLSFAKKYFPNYDANQTPYEKTIAYYKNGEIIGFMTYSIIYDRAEIDYFAVDKKYRGKGISDEIYDKFETNHVKSITLEVKCCNIKALNFYKKKGYKIISTRKNYYKDEDGYMMMKKLGE